MKFGDIGKTVNLELIGLDGNAFSLMAAFKHQAEKEGWTKEEIDCVLKECRSSNYQHLLNTLKYFCDNEEFPDEYDK
jgi:hypothetical protein